MFQQLGILAAVKYDLHGGGKTGPSSNGKRLPQVTGCRGHDLPFLLPLAIWERFEIVPFLEEVEAFLEAMFTHISRCFKLMNTHKHVIIH